MFLAVAFSKVDDFLFIFQAWISPTFYFQSVQFSLSHKTKTDTTYVSDELEKPNCLQQGEVSIYRDKKEVLKVFVPCVPKMHSFFLNPKTCLLQQGIVYMTCGDVPFAIS